MFRVKLNFQIHLVKKRDLNINTSDEKFEFKLKTGIQKKFFRVTAAPTALFVLHYIYKVYYFTLKINYYRRFVLI